MTQKIHEETLKLNYRLHSECLLQGLNELRQCQQLCDVVLRVDNVRILAHRAVLAGCSPYFRAMFTGNLSEKGKNDIELKSIDPHILQALIGFAYTGNVLVNQENVQFLLPAAKMLQLHAVAKQCCDFLNSQLHITNCIGIKRFAEMHACMDLCATALQFILQHFDEVIETEEFLQAPESEIFDLLSSDDLSTTSEINVFSALKTWVQYDWQHRHVLMPKLIKCLRLALLPVTFIEKIIKTDTSIEASVSDILKNVIKYKKESYLRLTPGKAKELGLVTKQREPPHSVCAVGGKNGMFATLDSIEVYIPITGVWTQMTVLPKHRFECGAAVYQHKLYVLGGMMCNRSGESLIHHHDNCVECWDVATGDWSVVAPMQQQRSALAVAVLQGCVYAIGGYDGESYLSSVERYCPKTNKWNYISPMLQCRSCFGAATLDGTLYVVGGYSPPCLNSIECYSPEEDSWELQAPMLEKRINCGVASLCGFLFVVGGHNGAAYLSSMERYAPESNQWTRVCSMGSPRTGLGVSVVDDMLYAVGGHSGSSYSNKVQRYDPFKDTWTEVHNMNTSRCSFGLVAL